MKSAIVKDLRIFLQVSLQLGQLQIEPPFYCLGTKMWKPEKRKKDLEARVANILQKAQEMVTGKTKESNQTNETTHKEHTDKTNWVGLGSHRNEFVSV